MWEENKIKEYNLKFSSIITNLQQENSEIPTLRKSYQSAIDACEQNFYGRFNRCLLECKNKILECLRPQKCLLNKIRMKKIKSLLQPLRKQPMQFLHEGIMGIQIQLIQLKDKNNLNPSFSCFIQDLHKAINPLFVFYSVFKQYQKRKNDIQEINENNPQSYTSVQRDIDEELMIEIQEEYSQYTIMDLLDSHLEDQKEKICGTLEICRVCGKKIKLIKLESHIKICSRHTQIEYELNQLEEEKKQLFDQIRVMERTFLSKQLTKEDMWLFKLVKDLQEDRNSRINQRATRRNSQDSNNIKIRFHLEYIKKDIEDFQQQFGHNQFLNKLYNNRQNYYKKKRRLENLQLSSNISSAQKFDDVGSIKSLEEGFSSIFNSNIIKTKKSLFAMQSRSSKKSSYPDQESHSSNSSSSVTSSNTSIQSSFETKDISFTFSKNQIVSKTTKKSMLQIQEDKNKGNFQKALKSLRKVYRYNELNSFKNYRQKPWKSMKQLQKQQQQNKSSQKQMSLNDFDILKFLGKGAFGRVYLVRRKKTGDLYALKTIKLVQQQESQKLKLIKKQHQIFKKIAGDHLIRAPFAFSEQNGHYFVLQFMPGGDLSQILAQQIYLEQDKAKFYLAQIVLAVEHLHNCDIIHRDLKPQNIVLDKNGHIKLTDFGLSEMMIKTKIDKAVQKFSEQTDKNERNLKKPLNSPRKNRTNRRAALINRGNHTKIVGTPDYIAPEIINQTSIDNKSIDWWSLGVIAYEIIVGCRPFAADTIQEVLDNIVSGRMQWPQIGREEEMISPEAADLIKKLLDKNFYERLGNLDVNTIKNHGFFKGIDWQNIKNQKPPLMPKFTSPYVLKTLSDDPKLREQLTSHSSTIKTKKSIKLDNFVRFDLLLQQTYESAEQKITVQKSRLKKLKSLVQDCRQNTQREYEKRKSSMKPQGKKRNTQKSRMGVVFKEIDSN